MIKTETISYSDSEKVFEGTICWDEKTSTTKPGVLVFPTFKGHSDFEIDKAVELAKLGYVGFAVDIYGKGISPQTPDEARVLMNDLNSDRPELLKRALLALETLRNFEQVDKTKLGGIGFCFGGKWVLDLVRANAELKGGTSFHGVYDKPEMVSDTPIKSSVLVLHGWDDPLNTPQQTVELAHELTERKADWQILSFGKTGHSFTNPAANMPESGLIYNELSNKRAWLAMKIFFEEIFGQSEPS